MRRPSPVACVAVFLATVSCGDSRPGERPEKRPEGRPENRPLVLAQVTSAVSLDPYLHDESSTASTLSHFYDKLVGFSADMDVVPELAVSWTNPSDTLWRFRLRKGVLFHDGRPCEAADVAASLIRARDLPGSRARYYVQSIADAVAIDAETVEVTTRAPTSVLLNKLVFIAIVPRDTPMAPITRPIGTGPYRFVAGAPAQPVEGERFERYWGPKPAFRRFRVVGIPAAKELAAAVPDGGADVASGISAAHWDEASARKGVRMVAREGLSVTMLGASLRKGSPFSDQRVRRAMSLAIDRAALAGARRPALATPMFQVVPPGVFGFVQDLAPERPDLDAARRLLAEAGLAAGLDAPFLVPEHNEPLGRAVAEQVARVGIRLAPTVLPWPEVYERWHRGEDVLFVFVFVWSAATGDASDVLDALFHSPENGYGGSNRFGYRSGELDSLVEAANRILDPYERLARVQQAMRVVRRDLPVIPLLSQANLYAVRPGLEWSPRRDRRLRAFDVKPAASGASSP